MITDHERRVLDLTEITKALALSIVRWSGVKEAAR